MTLEAAAERVEMQRMAEPATPLDPRGGARAVTSRTFLHQALRDTFNRIGAKLGLSWILLLAFAAVFAPWIANSFPLLIKIDGRWSSPLLAHLQPTDVTLLIAFLATMIAAIARLNFRSLAGIVIVLTSLSIPLTLWPSIIRDGWRPVPETAGPAIGKVVFAILAMIDLVALGFAIALLRRDSFRLKFIVAISACIIFILLIVFPVNPPTLNVYDHYRELAAAGKMQSVLNAPVPFSPSDYQRDNVDARLQPPSGKHWMGTEQSGADVFSRMLHASRIALSIGFIATGISVTIGVTIGGLMGYYAGAFDIFGMRLIEIIEAVPLLILLLTVCAFFGRNLYLMMTVIGLLSWTTDARYVRAEFLRLRNQDFVHAARAAGLPLRSILFRHMLPNGITPVLVNSSFNVASAILIESTLSFLGLGLVDEPSWGQLLEQARAGGTGFQWWIATFPGLAIFLTVFSYNLIGEAMRDALDPRFRKRE